MFNGSHSRLSHPFDKRIPKMPKSERKTTESGYTYYIGYDSNQRQLKKQMHKKKQREHNRRISEEGLYEEKETEANVAADNLES